MLERQQGLILLLSAPSGTGKGAVRARLLERRENLWYAVSVTTRTPRPDEVAGRDYRFVDEATFEQMRDGDELVEWAEVYGNWYGTPREPMETRLRQGTDVLLEKDVQGARTLAKRYPEAVHIFLVPPSLAELERRIRERGTESEAEMARRLESARKELARWQEYHYVVVNDRLDEAVDRVEAIYLAETSRVSRLRQLPVRDFNDAR